MSPSRSRAHRITPVGYSVPARGGVVRSAVVALAFLLSACGGRAVAVPRAPSDVAYALCLTGPTVSESDARNPFLHYRLDVDVDGPEGRYTVPGYFAADGDAANTGARAGDQWCARLRGFAAGTYRYSAKLYDGDSVALRQNLRDVDPGVAGAVLAQAVGSIEIAAPDEGEVVDGWLRYDPSGFPRFSESGHYFIKTGTNSPENLLAYGGFDGTYAHDTAKANFVRDYAPHERDYRDGDEGWGPGNGRGLIGALNYLRSVGVNGVYALTNNIGGDARDVWPFVSHDTLDRYDVSKLAQWDIVIQAAQARGIHWQFVTQEAENETMLDGGDTGPLRRLYYRELVARFGHHANITWNLGEENGRTPWNDDPYQTDNQRREMAAWFEANDPYRHPVVLHTLPSPDLHDGVLRPLSGERNLDGLSLQIDRPGDVHEVVAARRAQSDSAGHRWLLSMDEISPWHSGSLPDAIDPAHDTLRRDVLWGALMAGAYGVEWYYGWHTDQHDLNADDFRTREALYRQAAAARELFETLPFHTLQPAGEKVSRGWALSDGAGTHVVYLPDGGRTELRSDDMPDATYTVGWYEPNTGAVVATEDAAPSNLLVLTAPDAERDWLAVVAANSVR